MWAIVAAMLEIVACAGAAATTTYLIVQKRELRHFTSVKAEELYTLLEAFDQGLSGYLARTCALIADGHIYSQQGDALWSRLMQDSAKARMLMNFYFPALLPHARRADGALSATLGAMRRFQASHSEEPPMVALEQTLIDMRETLDTLKNAVVMAHRDATRRGAITGTTTRMAA